MRVEVLGSARVVADDGSLITFDRRHRRVLAALAAAGGDATLDALVDAVWSGEPPAAAHKTTQNLLSDLRRTLGPGSIERSGDCYRLAEVEVDAAGFSRLATETSDAAALRHGLATWRGIPFAELDEWPTSMIERARLIELRLRAEERLAELDVEQGRAELACADLEALVAAEPYREHRWALLVRAHAAAGRRGAALAAFQRARKVLVEHLGLEPGPELADAEREALAMPLATKRTRPQVRLVGRCHEREVLLEAWQRALRGSTQVVAIVGEAGVGKTHLASAVAAELAGSGALVGFGRADEAATEGSSPLTDALRDALTSLEPDDEDAAVQLAAELGTLLSGSSVGLSTTSSELAVANLARDVSAATARLTTAAPLLLVLDDVHWARPDDLELVRQIVGNEHRSRLLVVVCARDEAAPTLAGLSVIVEQAQGRFVRLAGLDADEVAELVGPGSAQLAAEYHYQTAGNPLACLLLDESRWRPGTAAPPSVAAAVRARLTRLGHDDIPFVEAAAITGLEFDPALVAAAVGASPSSPSAAVDAGLTEATPDGRHRFRHPLFRAVIADAVPAATATARHRELALAMRELAPAKVPEIAHHLVAAASLDVTLRPQAVAWAHRAAIASERRAAFDEAVRWYEAALRLYEVDDHERYDLLLGHSRALLARPGWEFRAPALQAATLADEALDDSVLTARALLAGSRDFPSADGIVDGPFIHALESAAARLGDEEPGLKAMLLAAEGSELLFDLDGWHRRRIADEALALAEQSGDDTSLRYVLCRRHAAIWDLSTADDRWHSAHRYLELADPSEVPGRLTALAAAAVAAIERADLDAAALLLARTGALTAGLPTGHFTVMHETVELELLLARGQLDEVRRRAMLLPDGSGAPPINFLLCADLQEDRGGEAAAELASQIQPAELAPFALLTGAADRPEAAASALAMLPPALWASIAPSTTRSFLLSAAALSAGILGDRAHADALLPLLEPFADHLLCIGQVGVFEPVAVSVGRLHKVLGNIDLARQRFSQAHRIAAAIGNANWCRQASELLTDLPAAG